MLATIPSVLHSSPRLLRRPGIPTRRQVLAVLLAIVATVAASTLVSTAAYLRLPAVTGPYDVGRTQSLLTDPVRLESRSAVGAHRQVRLLAWYPAAVGTGAPAAYVPGLDVIRSGLEASGELGPLEIAGLGAVTTSARDDATLAPGDAPYPVILLSPGNATNVAFYGALAEDLASHGYVVIGIDHPYQVAAVDLGEAGVAVYPGDAAPNGPGGDVPAKIDERVADIGLVLERLAADAGGMAALTGQTRPPAGRHRRALQRRHRRGGGVLAGRADRGVHEHRRAGGGRAVLVAPGPGRAGEAVPLPDQGIGPAPRARGAVRVGRRGRVPGRRPRRDPRRVHRRAEVRATAGAGRRDRPTRSWASRAGSPSRSSTTSCAGRRAPSSGTWTRAPTCR